MKLQNRLFLSVALMAVAGLSIGLVCLQSSRANFDNQAKVYNSGLAVYHLKKVSDAYGLDVIGAVQKVRSGAPWAWEEGGKTVAEAEKIAEDHWKAYQGMDKSKDEKYQASIVGALLDNNKHLMESLKNDFSNKDARDLEIQATSVLYPSVGPILDNIRKLEDLNEKAGQLAIAEAEKGFTGNYNFMTAVVVVILLAALVGSLLTASWALKPVGMLVRAWEEAMEQGSGLSSQVSSVATPLNSLLQKGAAQLQKTAGSMEEMISLTQQNNQETQRARNLMEETRSALVSGVEAANKTVDHAKAMGQSAERVFQIVKTIEEIAFQTNILALNAGVEAVRAGEQGKEFVLVVEEIRNLSQRCSQVARETSKMVTENSRQANDGIRLSEETGKALAMTSEKAGKVSGLLGVMEEGLDSQARGLREIHGALNLVEREAQRNSGMGEKTANAGSALSKQMETLQGLSKQLSDLVKGTASGQKGNPGVKKQAARTLTLNVSESKSRNGEPVKEEEVLSAGKTGTDGAKVISFKG